MKMFLRFVLVGGTGFVIDAGITYVLISAGLSSYVARCPAILIAMIYTWLINRSFTYRVKNTKTAVEGYRYLFVALIMAAVNYSVYALLVKLGFSPMLAIVLSTALQTVLSFHAYRRFVFS